MNQLKEDLIWIALGIPGMVLIGLVLHSLVHFETGVLVITSMILGTLLMVFCEALCKAAHPEPFIPKRIHQYPEMRQLGSPQQASESESPHCRYCRQHV